MDEEKPDERDERTKEVLNCFHPKTLWATFKDNWNLVLVWAAFFAVGWWLASQYYQSAANNFVVERCLESGKTVVENITWVDGTIFR